MVYEKITYVVATITHGRIAKITIKFISRQVKVDFSMNSFNEIRELGVRDWRTYKYGTIGYSTPFHGYLLRFMSREKIEATQ